MVAAAVQPIWDGFEELTHGTNLIEIIERRFEPAMIDRLLDLGFERAEINLVVIPSRTLQHRRSRKERLTVDESDRVVRVLRILKFTEEVFGSRERALKWLRTPKARLAPALSGQFFAAGGPVPMELLKTETGTRMVEQLLGQISEGMFI